MVETPEQTWTRYITKVEVDTPDTCWHWTASTNVNGYGIFKAEGQMRLAHRWMYQFCTHRTLDRGTVVRHTCDNRWCQNLNHLVEGTQGDNMRDAITRGRFPNRKGEANGRTRLSEAQVLEIFRSKEPVHALQQRFGFSSIQSVRNIQQSITWTHVTGGLR